MNHYAINIPFLNVQKMDHSKMDHSKMVHSSPMGSNPCTDMLSDIDYLVHMIPHHQVAIDMSNMLIPNTKNPQMLHLCRDIIRKQGYEIWEMEQMKRRLSSTIFDNLPNNVENFQTKMDLHAPKMSRAKDGNCNPLFFKPNQHSEHMKHMKITEKSYLEHMIQHHQVAINMSKRLLLHTNNSYLIEFCRKLILDQQREIYYMNNLLFNTSYYSSNIL